ncbi:ABC transporter ATP-binding protein/permease [Fulvivirga maritima]|uniref:ABC transporter ATP-binding protein n=1 Tax=Fulvivirga maritima TaxID=2904247 RepID=UPI001F1C16F2|nr:ABC transporter ATP-binding protein [Fulvivirga maritima]UII27566.1 ABC transporter ATP-binding protein/permease [Fulvivirga maritima]
MRLLFNYLKPYRYLLILALVFAVVNNSFNFLNPYILGNWLIDPFASKAEYYRQNGLGEQFYSGVLKGMLLMLIVSTISWIAKGYQHYYLNMVIQKFGADLFIDVQKHTMSLPYQDFEDESSGQILAILQRVRNDGEKFLTKVLTVVIEISIGITIVTIIAIQLSSWLVVVYLGGALLMFFLTRIISNKLKSIQQIIVDKTTALSGMATESLRNIELIKGLGLVGQEVARFKHITFAILHEEIKKLKSVRLIGFGYHAFVHSLQQLIIFSLILFVFYDRMTVGQLLMMQLYFFFIIGAMEGLGDVIVSYREAQASMGNMSVLLSKPVELRPLRPQTISAIKTLQFEDIIFKHKSARSNTLNNISFKVNRGDTVAFVGPSGAGKSTLVKLLIGLYEPLEGHVLINGLNQGDIDSEHLRSQIGMVTQDTQLFSGTIKENLLFVNPSASEQEIHEVLRNASCYDLLHRADHGLETIIGEGGLKLSGGERQRLAIARALLRKTSLLIFDEATSSLDSITEEGISRTIKEVTANDNYITLLIAHRLSTVMFADHIYVLENGEIVEKGTHYDLLDIKGLYYAMWRQQTGADHKLEPSK